MKSNQNSKNNLVRSLALLITPVFFVACFNDKKEVVSSADMAVNQEMVAELTAPPHVPKPIGARKPKKLKVKMEILEQEGELTGGVKYNYWTFGGRSEERRVGKECSCW